MQGTAPRGMSTPSELCVIDYRLSLNFPRQAVAVYALSSAQRGVHDHHQHKAQHESAGGIGFMAFAV